MQIPQILHTAHNMKVLDKKSQRQSQSSVRPDMNLLLLVSVDGAQGDQDEGAQGAAPQGRGHFTSCLTGIQDTQFQHGDEEGGGG